VESLIDLIGLAQRILDGGFDVESFLTWRALAFACLLGLLGPLHHYTKTFCRFTARKDERALLSARGLLYAAIEEIRNSELKPGKPNTAGSPSSCRPFTPWISRRKKWRPLTALRS
jgi:hypothetical protein